MLRLPAKPYRFGGCPCADCCNGREPRTTATMYGDDAMSGTYVMDLHSRHIEQHSVPELGLGARSAGWTPVWVDVPAISAVDVEETRKECGRCKVMKHKPDFLRTDWKQKWRVWDSTKCRMCVSCLYATRGIMIPRKACGRCKMSKTKAGFLKDDWAKMKRAWGGTKCRLCSLCVKEVNARKFGWIGWCKKCDPDGTGPRKPEQEMISKHVCRNCRNEYHRARRAKRSAGPGSSGSSDLCITLSFVHGQTTSMTKSIKDVHLIVPST